MPTVAVFFLGTFLAIAQQDHQAMVNEHGDQVMGFSHGKTTHHFELHYDGGLIDVRADDGKDVPGTATMTQLKDQLHWQLQIPN